MNNRDLPLVTVFSQWWFSQEIKRGDWLARPSPVPGTLPPAPHQRQTKMDKKSMDVMNQEALLTSEQARLLKKKKPAKRTKERYKYVNAAVAQAAILGLDKLVFVTMCEFAADNGLLWHGERSLAIATGLSQPTVHRCIERLIALGVVVLLYKGGSKWDTNIYRVNVIDTAAVPTVYSLAKDYRLKKQGDLQPIPPESVADETDSVGIGEPGEPILCESKDIEFDFDSSQFSFKTGNDGGFAAVPEDLEENKKSQSQNQNHQNSELRRGSRETKLPAANQNQTAEKNETEKQPSKPAPPFRSFADELSKECEFCLQTMDNHHKNCKLLGEAHYA